MNDDTLFKAVHPNGTDFRTGKVQWAPPPGHEGEWIVRHPTATKVGGQASEYLSVSTVATDCTGMEWPCRLLTVEAVGDITKPSPTTLPSKRAGVAFRVTGELPAHEVFGPQCEHVAALLERARHLTLDEASALDDALDGGRYAAWEAARDAAWDVARAPAAAVASAAARAAARGAARAAARDAAGALVVRGLITTEDYDTLTRPWRTVIGPIHPDDPAPATIQDTIRDRAEEAN